MASTNEVVAAGGAGAVSETVEVNMTPAMRYYYRHRDEKKAKDLARYHSKPEVIAKKEERAQKRAEKEAEKEAKRVEKERIRQEMMAIAEATKRRLLEKERLRQEKVALAETTKRQLKEKSGGGLDSVLGGVPPV
jgi:hypothetical protein